MDSEFERSEFEPPLYWHPKCEGDFRFEIFFLILIFFEKVHFELFQIHLQFFSELIRKNFSVIHKGVILIVIQTLDDNESFALFHYIGQARLSLLINLTLE